MSIYEFAESFIQKLSKYWDATQVLFTSPLGEVLIGTAIASFAGVLGAHHITERLKRRDQNLKELRVTNAAIMTAFEISNSMLGLKEQYVRELYESYNRCKSEFDAFEAKRNAGNVPDGEIFVFETDLMTLYPMLMPSEILTKQIHENISSPARAYTLTGVLLRSIDSLNQSINNRNELIELRKKHPTPKNQAEFTEQQKKLVRFYFGLADPTGHVDTSYPNSVEAISSLTDDCIQFSYMLGQDLVEHGKKLKKTLGRKSPNVNIPNFDRAFELGLMPDSSNYKEWESMFRKHPKKGWFISLFQFLFTNKK